MLQANFTFQNAAEIELERGKKTEKFILIITLKAYINGDNFRAFSYLPWNSKSVWLDYEYLTISIPGNSRSSHYRWFLSKNTRPYNSGIDGSSSMMRKSSRNRGHIYDTSSGHKLPFYNTISQFFLDGSWHREEFYQISLADLRTPFLLKSFWERKSERGGILSVITYIAFLPKLITGAPVSRNY